MYNSLSETYNNFKFTDIYTNVLIQATNSTTLEYDEQCASHNLCPVDS